VARLAARATRVMVDIYNLEKNSAYIVSKGFTDFYGNVFAPGERLTYVERHFLPYHGGHTFVFKERNLYLQEEANKNIIDSFGDYLARDVES
jgi:hypothetical protein